MDNKLMTFENAAFGKIRTITIDGEPWFVAVDVCRALEIGNPTDAMRRLDADERTLVSIEGASNGLPVNAVNEPGLYTLILGSRKPEAKAFKRWITHEVIPAIRKQWQMDDLCRALLGAVRKFYESEENVKKFQEWKQARERRRKEENNEH